MSHLIPQGDADNDDDDDSENDENPNHHQECDPDSEPEEDDLHPDDLEDDPFACDMKQLYLMTVCQAAGIKLGTLLMKATIRPEV